MRARVPAPLGALLCVVLIVGLAWVLIVPAWQSPDEIAHFSYAQSLATRFALPGRVHAPEESTDMQDAADLSLTNYVPFHAEVVKPAAWDSRTESAYLALYRREHPSQSDGGGYNTAETYPPLYYLYADIGYWADIGGNSVDRQYAMQIWGITLLLATVVGAWLLAGEVFGRRRLVQLTSAAVTGLQPMESFIGTSVTPDALMVPLWTFALWLGARVILRGARRRDTLALCAVTAAAILTKATSYALLPAVLFALALGALRCPGVDRRRALGNIAAGLVVLAAPVLGWIGLTRALSRPALSPPPSGGKATSINQFLSYVWQFYLPRLPSLVRLRETQGLPVYAVWLKDGWGVFGWLEIYMPGWAYTLLSAISVALGAAVVSILARLRDSRRLALVAFVGLAMIGLLGVLHVTDYLNIDATGYSLLQGRYLLPLVAVLGLCFGLVVSRLPARGRAYGAAAVLAGMLLLQILALSTVAKAYYT